MNIFEMPEHQLVPQFNKYQEVLFGFTEEEKGQQLIRGMILYRCDPIFWDKVLTSIPEANDEFYAMQAEMDQLVQKARELVEENNEPPDKKLFE